MIHQREGCQKSGYETSPGDQVAIFPGSPHMWGEPGNMWREPGNKANKLASCSQTIKGI